VSGARSRWLVVVSSRDPALFRYLSRSCAGAGGLEVIVDRRKGDRRRGGGVGPTPERRRRERRAGTASERFPALGYEIARRDPPPEATGPDPPAGTTSAYRTLLWPAVKVTDLDPPPPGRRATR
jgi:hypothetical protein